MTPRTIILLIDDLHEWTGTEMHLVRLVKNLDPTRIRALIAVVGRADLGPEFVAQGIPVFPLSIYRTFAWSGLVGVSKIAALIRRERASLLVTYHTAADLLGPIAGQLSRCPVISCRRDEGFTKRPIHIRFQRPLNLLLRGMISNSYSVVRAVERLEGYPPHKNQVIWNGEDLDRFSPGPSDLREELGLDEQACVITCVGLLSPVKDHETQLAAFEQVIQKCPDTCLVVVGDGPGRARLESQASKFGSKVRFLGHRKDVPQILRGSNIFLQTSLSEGFSNAILQAMATSLPVVVTAVGGNPELVSAQCGALLPAKDVNGIANELIALASDRSRREAIGQTARQRALTHFSLPMMAERFMDAFERGIDGRFPGPSSGKDQALPKDDARNR